MICDLKPRLIPDHRGSITCGDRNSKGFPQKLDHWNISAFPELVAIYGDKPKELLVYVPGTLEEVFDCYKGAWGGSTAKRICDGRECTHRIQETIGGQRYAEGEISACVCTALPPESKERCDTRGRVYVMVAHPETRQIISPCIYVMRTGSRGNIESVYSELWRVTALAQAIPGHPKLHQMLFSITVHMASSSGSAKRTFPVWRMQAVASESYFQQIAAGRAIAELPQEFEEHDADLVGDEDYIEIEESPVALIESPQPLPQDSAPAHNGVAAPPAATPPPHKKKPEAASVQMVAPKSEPKSPVSGTSSPPMPPSEMIETFHRLGKELYGVEKWEKQQDTIATWISHGSAPVAALITAPEMEVVCWIMHLKLYCAAHQITEDQWKDVLHEIGLIDIAKMTERQSQQLQLLLELQVLRMKHGWTIKEWDYLVETLGVIDLATIDAQMAKRVANSLSTRRQEIIESMEMEALERGQAS